MGNLNKVLLIGRITQDIEKRVTSGGNSVASVSFVTNEKYKDKQGQNQEKSEFHKLVFWNQQAELVEKWCHKGSQLFIEGSLQTREWLDKNQNKRYTTEIVVKNMQFLDSKQTAGHQAPPQNQQNNQRQPQQQDYLEDD